MISFIIVDRQGAEMCVERKKTTSQSVRQPVDNKSNSTGILINFLCPSNGPKKRQCSNEAPQQHSRQLYRVETKLGGRDK